MFNGHHFVLHLCVKATQTSATILLPYDFQEIEKLRAVSTSATRWNNFKSELSHKSGCKRCYGVTQASQHALHKTKFHVKNLLMCRFRSFQILEIKNQWGGGGGD